MDELIEALTILKKYVKKGSYDYRYPLENKTLIITAIEDKETVTEEDMKRLEELSFSWSEENNNFVSTQFGEKKEKMRKIMRKVE